jgi:hypothetical protein
VDPRKKAQKYISTRKFTKGQSTRKLTKIFPQESFHKRTPHGKHTIELHRGTTLIELRMRDIPENSTWKTAKGSPLKVDFPSTTIQAHTRGGEFPFCTYSKE